MTDRLIPPAGGATVRMFRTGHGDCFLLAFSGDDPERPVYVLIDCGYKPGSPKHLGDGGARIDAIARAISDSTGGIVDVAVITHEHQDHVNGISQNRFAGITIEHAWFAWTEKPGDALADALRERFHDRLLGLLGARQRLAAAGDEDAAERVRFLDQLLAFELGGGDEEDFDAPAARNMLLGAAASDPLRSKNKVSMQVFKAKAQAAKGITYLYPHQQIHALPGASNVRVYALGPPYDEDLLTDLDPQGEEVFHFNRDGELARRASRPPFAGRYCCHEDTAVDDATHGAFFSRFLGPRAGAASSAPAVAEDEVSDDASWRRLGPESLYSPEQLALDLSDYTNNSSLVLAFELGKGGKVLLFAADAQRGNWISWAGKDWPDGDQTVTARDLLGRTVLYKVGHHGSHNATLDGKPDADYANLSWMGQGRYGREFTAMITAVRAWAETQNGWDHPLKAIKDALLQKAGGRVFQTDTSLAAMQPAPGASAAEWADFQRRAHEDPLFFDYAIEASP
jgi:hypothetical protein